MLKSVAAVLVTVTDDIKKTYASVEAVVGQLDSTIVQLKENAGKQANATAAAAVAAAIASSAAGAEGGGGGEGDRGRVDKADRVSSLATELGKALGGYSGVAETFTTGECAVCLVTGVNSHTGELPALSLELRDETPAWKDRAHGWHAGHAGAHDDGRLLLINGR